MKLEHIKVQWLHHKNDAGFVLAYIKCEIGQRISTSQAAAHIYSIHDCMHTDIHIYQSLGTDVGGFGENIRYIREIMMHIVLYHSHIHIILIQHHNFPGAMHHTNHRPRCYILEVT